MMKVQLIVLALIAACVQAYPQERHAAVSLLCYLNYHRMEYIDFVNCILWYGFEERKKKYKNVSRWSFRVHEILWPSLDCGEYIDERRARYCIHTRLDKNQTE
ncbi:unnamed protein product [Trichogramma brassicae]|uniref:Uncharacterized protein n=1 Tax=Trichogramma brassicae TaxID=86971 RepID=A0A6H5J7J4_9HYME|nr:unnamed protein product [Trichogramma brassicae]